MTYVGGSLGSHHHHWYSYILYKYKMLIDSVDTEHWKLNRWMVLWKRERGCSDRVMSPPHLMYSIVVFIAGGATGLLSPLMTRIVQFRWLCGCWQSMGPRGIRHYQQLMCKCKAWASLCVSPGHLIIKYWPLKYGFRGQSSRTIQ